MVDIVAELLQSVQLFTRINSHESNNEAHTGALRGQFEKRAIAAGVEFTAQHVAAFQVNKGILEQAEIAGCDLIVMVTHGRSAVGEFLFGSVVRIIFAKSRRPVFVLH